MRFKYIAYIITILSLCPALTRQAQAQSPGGVTGARIWLKANAGTSTTTNGTGVQTWNDQSGNTNHVTQATAGSRPQYRNNSTDNINFNPVLNFDGTDDNLADANGVLGTGTYTDASGFAVSASNSTSQNNTIFAERLSPGILFLMAPTSGSNQVIWAAPDVTNSLNPAWGGSTGTPYLWTGWNNNSLTPKSTVRRNALTLDSANTAISYTGNTNPFNVGKGTTAVNYFDGRIGEVIFFRTAITAAERQRVESYLAIKYGLTMDQTNPQDYLASDGTVIWTGNSTYTRAIAGIGRDDGSALVQKQSQSENGGSQVVIALGTVAASNSANANSFTSDKQFFTWGYDNGSLGTLATTGNNNFTYRFSRIWKTQNTNGFAQNITVYFPVNAFNNSPASKVNLIYGATAASLSNGTASTILQSGTTTINGASYYAFTVPAAQVVNMQFFSFTSGETYPGGVSAGLNLWIKGDVGFTPSLWTDQSGNAFTFQQATAGNRPAAVTGGMNFNTAVKFDGVNDNMTMTSVAGLMNNSIDADRTVSMALRNPTTTNLPITDFDGSCGANGDVFFNSNGGVRQDVSPCGTSQPTYGGSAFAADINILNSHTYTNSSGALTVYRNNLQTSTTTTPALSSGLTSGTLGLNSLSAYYDGNIGDFIIHNRVLSSTERQRVDAYLAIRYGITLGNTGTPISYLASDGTTTTWTGSATYQNNVAGIGRDDLTALNQKQSQSTNTSSQVIVALGTAAANNGANANTFASDKQYFIWGDDNGSLTNIVATGNNTYPYRFTRVWITQNTGSFAQNSTVYYPVSAFGNAQSSTVSLLYGTSAASLSNGTATAIAQSGTTTIGGVSYYVFSVPAAQIANMQFFSFTGTQTAPGGVVDEALWLKADAGTNTTTDGASVTSWNDQSVAARNAGNANAVTYRSGSNSTYAINFNPAVDFTAANSRMYNITGGLASASSASLHLFLITNVRSGTSSEKMFSGFTNLGASFTNNWADIPAFRATGAFYIDGSAGGGAGTLASYSPSIIGNDAMLSLSINPGASTVQMRQNGLQTVNTTGVSLQSGTQGYVLGNDIFGGGGNNNAALSTITEAIAYEGQLTGTTLTRVESYLALKYGITLGTTASSVSYLASDGTTTTWTGSATYQNNIAGIGRDELTALNQKQSQSQNGGSQVVIALGTVAASNSANANSFTSDKQFFIWGDDNGSLTNIVTTGNTTYPFRFSRVWKTQNTNSFAQNSTVYYPVSAFGNALASTVSLLYGTSAASLSNGTATAIAQSGTTSVNGVSHYIFTVPAGQIANMQFFSFTGTQTAPGGVTGENLWLRADAGTNTTTNGATVTTWADQSGNDRDVTQADGNGAVLYNTAAGNSGFNFNPSLYFDNTTDALRCASGVSLFNTANQSATLFGVGNAGYYLQANNPAATGTSLYDAPDFATTFMRSTGIIVTFPAASTSTISRLNTGLFIENPSGTDQGQASTDAGTYTTASSEYVLGTDRFLIGSDVSSGGNDATVIGNIPEVVVYESQLSATNISRVQSYLALKYGLTLDQTTPQNYVATDGTVTWTGSATYTNNIAGIGRDDLTALNQKQSQSVNTGTSQVVLALGTAAASNQVNANAFTSDKQFFIWGDDNGSLTTIVATGNSTYPYRFTRVWKTQNTNSFAQNSTVYYPVSAFGNAQASTVSLLYGTSAASLSNGTASAIAQSGTTSINGVSHYVFTVPAGQIANMQFFSFTGTQSSPGGVTGEVLWLRSDVGTSTTTNGTGVQTWNDQSGNSNDVTQATAANRPEYRDNSSDNINFNPALNFDGTNDDLMNANGVLGTGSYTDASAFVVAVTNSATATNTTIYQNTSGSNIGLYIPAGTGNALWDGPVASRISVAWGGTTGVPYLWTGWNNNSLSPRSSLRRNGLQLATDNTAITYTGNNSSFYLGSRAGAGLFLNARIGEVILFTTALTANQRQQVESYLALKYSTMLDQSSAQNYLASDGSVIWNATSNSTYKNNIAGIGRDDLSALYQKQSQSVNSGSQVAMALGTAAASNQANANTIPTDKQFFIWGDDNGSLTTLASTGNSTYPYRFTRVWKTQNTNSFAQGTTVYYPVSAFGNAQASTVSLLYGTSAASLSNGTATVIAQSGTTTINGVSHYIFTVPAAEMANLQFFSFTGTISSPGGVTGESLWLKADAGTSTTTDGGNITSWADQSGNGNNATTSVATGFTAHSSAGATYRDGSATVAINFNPAVDFTGNKSMDGNAGMSTRQVFCVAKPSAVSSSALGYGNSAGGVSASAGMQFMPTGISHIIEGTTSVNFATFFASKSISGLLNTPFITDGQHVTGNSGSALINGGGASIGSSGGTPPAAYTGPYRLGAKSNNSVWLNAPMGETISYNTNLTATQRQQVSSYLAVKWGITYTQNYLASDGTTTIYNVSSYANNIAGIGRDDLTALYQKQSQSVNQGTSQVVMALGTAAASNQANANTIPTDKQFFIWGDDNGSLTDLVVTGNGTYPFRFTRVWKTQNTNSFAQNSTVYYPVSAFGNAQASTVSLLYGTSAASLSNGTATAVAQSGTTTINGVSHYIFTVPAGQIANMQFFSFTGTQTAPGGVVNGLKIWHRADVGVTESGGDVTAWLNNADGVSQVTNSGGVQTPNLTDGSATEFNFNPYLAFDAVSSLRNTSATPFTTDGSISLFYSLRMDGAAQVFGVNQTPALTGINSYTNFSWKTFAIGDGITDEIYSTFPSLGDQVIHTSTHDGTANQLTAYTNLQQVINAPFTLQLGSGGYALGSNLFASGSTSSFVGGLSELTAYDRVLTATEIKQVQTYLAIRSGVTLNQDHLASDGTTNIWNATTNAGYANNIAGIGRDDLSGLLQKQSTSINAGMQTVISLGGIAATNQANANTIPTDKQFFIWGDDNGSITTMVATGNSTYTKRFTRIWKTQNTNSFAQDMTVYYPVSAFGTSPAAKVSLLYGASAASLSNGTAATIAQSGTVTINSVNYYVFTVPAAQVGNMQYFSFTGYIGADCIRVNPTIGQRLGTP